MLALLLLVQDIPLATLRSAEAERVGIRGDILRVPGGKSDDDFAAQIVAAEGLKSWSPDEQRRNPTTGPTMRSRAIHAANGQEVIVYYAVDPEGQGHGTVCRLRASRGGVSKGWWESYRWCAMHFGMTPPDEPPPPITGP